MDIEVSKNIHDIMQTITAELDHSIRFVMENASHEDFLNYRRAAGNVMGHIFTDIMMPIHKEHPELTPEYLRQ